MNKQGLEGQGTARKRIRVPVSGPPISFMGEKSRVRMILLVFPGNHMDQGGRKAVKKCPPAGTDTKISFPSTAQ